MPGNAFLAHRVAPMRFLMLNWRDPKNPLAGGAERVTAGYLSALKQRGHEVFWFANHFPGAAIVILSLIALVIYMPLFMRL